MFSTLLESRRRRTPAGGSLVFSTAIHLLVAGVGLGVFGTEEVPVPKPDSFITRALFMPPRDRIPAAAGSAERLQYLALGLPYGVDGYTDLPEGASEFGRPFMDPTTGVDVGDQDFASIASLASASTDTAYSVLDVDSTVMRVADSDAPVYPPALLEQSVEGVVFMRYVVDTLGSADVNSFEVVRSSHPAFTAAVLAALPRMRFRPATIASRRVRQLVEQEFAFRIQPADVAANAP